MSACGYFRISGGVIAVKYLLKGIGLGLTLNAANRICEFFMQNLNSESVVPISAIIFGIIITAFLVSDNVAGLFLCGFAGLFTMFMSEIFIFSQFFYIFDFDIYVGGLYGSLPAIILALILTVKHFKFSDFIASEGDGIQMDKSLKLRLIIYGIISAISFSYLVLPEDAGVSVPVFTVLQFTMLWFIAPSKKRLIFLVPVFIMSLNSFISANDIWRVSNFIISILLYSCMFTDISFRGDSLKFISNTIINAVYSFSRFAIPFKWAKERSSGKIDIIKRICLALVITVPCVIVLIIVLSNADMVFSVKTENFLEQLLEIISINTMFKVIFGIVLGLFLFGLMYNANSSVCKLKHEPNERKGDIIVINVLLSAILVIYTIFVIIQFKYLFAGSTLPQGLNYTQYARKGFFELLSLTGVNIGLILTVIKLTKAHNGKWLAVCKILCHYLCLVTIVLLISSFYRMFLYTNDDGLTRLRFFVMGFLVFEAIGLIITFVYIAKPKFNIVLVYTILALTYYTMLNIVPADNIIAKNQIDKYIKGERKDIEYVYTLSADAVPAMKELYKKTKEEEVKKQIENFIETKTSSNIPERWQRYNFSIENAKKFNY